MSLATRCTSCGTVFRVVQDQLKVSEGWVRCGRCESVFNALEGLLDLDRETPTGWDEAAVHHAAAPLAAAPGVEREAGREDPTQRAAAADAQASAAAVIADVGTFSATAERNASTGAAFSESEAFEATRVERRGDDGATVPREELLSDPIDAHLFGPRKRAESAPKPAGQLGARDRLEFSDARFDSDLFAEPSAEPEDADPSTVAAELPLEISHRPEFVRRADRHAHWRSGPMRALLMLAGGLAALTLALQAGHHFRDNLAADWPSLRPALAAWCRVAGCALEAPRRIEAVTVESTALARAVGFDAYVLSVSLRNRSPQVLMLPAVDLTLTDGNGRLVARRVLSARDFRVPARLPAGAELPLQLTLGTGQTPVAGYTVEIFYP